MFLRHWGAYADQPGGNFCHRHRRSLSPL